MFLIAMVSVLVAKDLRDAADVGTLFGGFAGAFAIVLVGIQIALQRTDIRLQSKQLEAQREELSLQRRELELTRWEISEQSGHLSEQSRIMARQLESNIDELDNKHAQLMGGEWGLSAWAVLSVKNHGDTSANLAEFTLRDRSSETVAVDRASIEKFLNERLTPWGCQTKVVKIPRGYTVGAHESGQILDIRPSAPRKRVDLKALDQIEDLVLWMKWVSPLQGGVEQNQDIPLAYLKHFWEPQ